MPKLILLIVMLGMANCGRELLGTILAGIMPSYVNDNSLCPMA
jgi:hypothetical protein